MLGIVALVSATASELAAPATARSQTAAGTFSVLFDDTKAETAGNADWIVSTSMPDPTAQSPSPSTEASWTGAISAWGVALQKTGHYRLQTLPPTGRITYGDSANPQDLSTVNEFVLPEPNVLFTAAQKTAIMTFVQNGGGLFMVSDHNASDRNNDGADSVRVLNDLMTNNTVDGIDPFGFSIDLLNIANENPNRVGASAGGDPIVAGPFGAVTGSILRNGTTATLHPADNPAAKGEIYRSSFSASGTTGVAFASSTFGTGRVAFWGDSSPMDDGTGEPSNNLFNGWNDPAATDAALALNATEWLAGGGRGGGGGTERVTNGGFESGLSAWTGSGGAAATSARTHAGALSVALCSANNCAAAVSQQISIPAGATLSFQTFLTTQETGATAFDKLTVTAGGLSLATLSNVSAKSAWIATSANLAALAGQTLTLTFRATNGTKLPTSFWVDDVSVLG